MQTKQDAMTVLWQVNVTTSSSSSTPISDVQRYYRRSFILVLIISAIFLCITLSIVGSLVYCWCKRSSFSKKRNGVTARVEFAECGDDDDMDADDLDSDERDECDAASGAAGVAPLTAGNNAGLGASSDKRRLIPRSRSTETHCSVYSNASFVYEDESGAARRDQELIVNRSEAANAASHVDKVLTRSTTCSDGFRELAASGTSPIMKAFGDLANALYSRVKQHRHADTCVRRSQTQCSTNELLRDDVQCSELSETQPHSRSETQLVIPRNAQDDRVLFERTRQAKRMKVSALLRNDSQLQAAGAGAAASANTQETAI